jgi:cytochrome c biogenesis protein CcdA
MTSLADAYDQRAGEVSRRRLYLGTGLFVGGALLVVGAIVAGGTTALSALGFTLAGARELAGVLLGLGVPAVFLGIFVVLPASTLYRAAAAVGAGVAILGVMLFRYAYPDRWYAASGAPTDLTLLVGLVYFAGTMTTFWCLFTAIATFKRRNDPGGTVSLTFTENGETRTVRVAAEDADAARQALGGGVGVFGGIDDPAGTTDGGATTRDVRTPGADGGEVLESDPTPEPSPSRADRYCGNCESFRYVRTDAGIRPYCGFHGQQMDDMDACEEWSPNNPAGAGDGDVDRL